MPAKHPVTDPTSTTVSFRPAPDPTLAAAADTTGTGWCAFFVFYHQRGRALEPPQLMNDFMDASLDNIAELVGLVDQWNNKIPAPGPDGQDDAAAAAAVAAIEAGRGGGSAGGRGSPASIGNSRRSGGEKFCTECGAKIPASAKFCSECGAKQEETVPAA